MPRELAWLCKQMNEFGQNTCPHARVVDRAGNGLAAI